MRGIPVEIAQTDKYPGDQQAAAPVGTTNAAAVDSELAVLGYQTRIISGALNNPYYRSFSPIADAGRPELMLVCRLDGPSPAIVRRMILDGIAAEQEGARRSLTSMRADHDGGCSKAINGCSARRCQRGAAACPWFSTTAGIFPRVIRCATRRSIRLVPITRQGLRPPGLPLCARGGGGYIHSFSADTVRDPLRHWVGPLLAAGAAVTLGNVYEPHSG